MGEGKADEEDGEDECDLPAHRVVLAASCEYFRCGRESANTLGCGTCPIHTRSYRVQRS